MSDEITLHPQTVTLAQAEQPGKQPTVVVVTKNGGKVTIEELKR